MATFSIRPNCPRQIDHACIWSNTLASSGSTSSFTLSGRGGSGRRRNFAIDLGGSFPNHRPFSALCGRPNHVFNLFSLIGPEIVTADSSRDTATCGPSIEKCAKRAAPADIAHKVLSFCVELAFLVPGNCPISPISPIKNSENDPNWISPPCRNAVIYERPVSISGIRRPAAALCQDERGHSVEFK